MTQQVLDTRKISRSKSKIKPSILQSMKVTREESELCSFTTEMYSQLHIRAMEQVKLYSRLLCSIKHAWNIAASTRLNQVFTSQTIGSQVLQLLTVRMVILEATSMILSSSIFAITYKNPTKVESIPTIAREISIESMDFQETGSVTVET